MTEGQELALEVLEILREHRLSVAFDAIDLLTFALMEALNDEVGEEELRYRRRN